MSRRPWTPDDVAKLREMARRLPTVQIAKELERGVSATVMMAHGPEAETQARKRAAGSANRPNLELRR